MAIFKSQNFFILRLKKWDHGNLYHMCLVHYFWSTGTNFQLCSSLVIYIFVRVSNVHVIMCFGTIDTLWFLSMFHILVRLILMLSHAEPVTTVLETTNQTNYFVLFFKTISLHYIFCLDAMVNSISDMFKDIKRSNSIMSWTWRHYLDNFSLQFIQKVPWQTIYRKTYTPFSNRKPCESCVEWWKY